MMKTTALSLILGTMFVVGAAQAQPAKLTTSQMDQVTAGFLDVQSNFNVTRQRAVAVANACRQAGCNGNGNRSGGGNTVAAAAQATNTNGTLQFNIH
jgi:hypothetical protein